MLNKQEIEEYIAELEAQKKHTIGDLNLLSTFYSIMDHAFNDSGNDTPILAYSQAAAPTAQSSILDNYGDSDFLLVVSGKDSAEAWGVIDDLMDTLRVANPRVYDSVMRKLKQL